MKTIMILAAVLTLAGTQLQTARAGGREWAAANVYVNGSVGYDNYSGRGCGYTYGYNACPSPRVVYVPAPVVCAPRPIVFYSAPVVCASPVVHLRYGYARARWHGHHGHR